MAPFSMVRLVVAVAAGVALASCGGGGGGDGGGAPATPAPPSVPAPPAAGATVPLVLTTANAEGAATLALATGEGLLQLAEHAIEVVQRVRGATQTNLSLDCPGAGRVDLVFTDVDGNRLAGVGDSLRATTQGCQSSALNGRSTGEWTLTLDAPAAGAVEAYTGTLRYTAGYRITDVAGADPFDVGGTMRIEWRAERLQTTLRATVGMEVLTITDASTAAGGIERIVSATSAKTVNFESATIVNRLSGAVESAVLNGRIQYSTNTDFEASLNVMPTQGELRVTGAGATQLDVVAVNRGSGGEARLELDSNGDGTAESQATVPMTELVEGFLWWERGEFPDITATGYRAYASNEFRQAFVRVPNPFPVLTGEVTLQFSRPLTAAPALRFAAQDALLAQPFVAARVTREGARVTVTPGAQLEHGARYDLRSTSGLFIDATGTTLSLSVNSPIVAASNLVATIGPASRISVARAPLRLDGSVSSSTDGPVRSYLWRQRSGNPAQIEDAAAANTRLIPGAGGIAGERIDVDLEITNGATERDTQRVTLYSIPAPLAVSTLYLRADTPTTPPLGGQPYVVVTSQTGSLTTQRGPLQGIGIFYTEPIQNGTAQFYNLSFSGPGGAALAVGSYEGARGAGDGGNAPVMNIAGNGAGCSSTFGRFDVREVEYAGDGSVNRLAIDFEQRCPLQTSPVIFGSVRVRSDLPVRE